MRRSMRFRTGQLATRTLVLLLAVWAGVVIGVSFLATPAKFLAESISMAQALDVGRHTFRVLSTVELSLAIMASALCWFASSRLLTSGGLMAVWLVLLAERFWLLPVLDERVALYFAGSPPAATYHHTLFIGAEMLKVVLLLICAVSASTTRTARNLSCSATQS
jgi:hypothetical protein